MFVFFGFFAGPLQPPAFPAIFNHFSNFFRLISLFSFCISVWSLTLSNSAAFRPNLKHGLDQVRTCAFQMVWVEYVCLILVKENFENVFKTCVIALELPMKGLIIGIWKQKMRISDFELRGISEFREVSHESLYLTGAPSANVLKPELCWQSQSLQMIASFENIFYIRVLVLELPAQWFKASPLLVFLC